MPYRIGKTLSLSPPLSFLFCFGVELLLMYLPGFYGYLYLLLRFGYVATALNAWMHTEWSRDAQAVHQLARAPGNPEIVLGPC
jgi:hypothetical protein